MNKQFCDRCGAEIVKTERTLFDAVSDAMETLKANFSGKHIIKYQILIIDENDPRVPAPVADLCEQCEHDLTAFMNKFKEKPEPKNLKQKSNDLVVK